MFLVVLVCLSVCLLAALLNFESFGYNPPRWDLSHFVLPSALEGDKATYATHSHPSKPLRKIKVVICITK